jgi:hypothetical protein
VLRAVHRLTVDGSQTVNIEAQLEPRTLPFGFRLGDDGELVMDEGEQEAIVKIIALRAEGRPLRAIAAIMAWRVF